MHRDLRTRKNGFLYYINEIPTREHDVILFKLVPRGRHCVMTIISHYVSAFLKHALVRLPLQVLIKLWIVKGDGFTARRL
jgi:hypothetical protein